MNRDKIYETVTGAPDAPVSQHCAGIPLVVIVPDGDAKEKDEWILFELTEIAWDFYDGCPELRSGIMGIEFDGQPSGEEIGRHKARKLAVAALSELPSERRKRTLIRPVPPKVE